MGESLCTFPPHVVVDQVVDTGRVVSGPGPSQVRRSV